jgi:hypothetical protein
VNSTAVPRYVYALMALLALAILLCLGAELLTIGAPILKNYNEGWNAYHAAAAFGGAQALYPPPQSLLTNNYPPLSYFMVSAVSHGSGMDAIIAGRVVAFLCTLGIGVCLGFAARALGCDGRQSLFAALLFWAAPWVIVKFSAMDDPQMLGNLFDALGLLVILRGPRTMAAIALCALFLTLAEFVKPLYVTLPLALLAWLFLVERRSALLLAGFGLLFALAGYALTLLTLHVELLGHLFSPRIFLWSKLTGQPGQWLLVEFLPFAASLALLRRKNESPALFVGLYAVLAFVLAVFFSGGDGVSASQMIDVSMAVALGAAVYWNRSQGARWTMRGISFVAGFQAVMLVLAFLGVWALRPSLPELMGTRYATRYDTGVIARHSNPVLCETMALCYWAGRTPQVDAFGFTQAVRRGARPASDLTRLLDAHAFSMIQLAPGSVFFPPSPLWGAVVRNYYLEHQDKNGLFLIPRS